MISSVSGISVVVPTHLGREELTERLLRSLEAERNSFIGLTEIIVVDDDSARDSRVERACSAAGAVYLRGGWSAGAKRNAGARRAHLDVVLFVDSDCVAGPGLLAGHAECYSANEDVGGVAGPTDMYGPRERIWDVIDASREYNQCYNWPRVFEQVRWSTTSNLSVRREAFLAIDGFATDTYTSVGGEDVDFGVRFTDAGWRIVTNPDAVVQHTQETIVRFREVARSLYTYGRADVWLCDRHSSRTVRYRNGVAEVVLATIAGILLSVVSKKAVVMGPVALALQFARRLKVRASTPAPGSADDDPYGSRLNECVSSRATPASVARHLAAIALDASFEIGTIVESTRRVRFSMWFHRFEYLDEAGFVPRRRSPVSSTTWEPTVR